MSISGQIKLTNTNVNLYYPGQAVSGVVEINIFDDYVVKGLNIKLIGYVTGALCLSGETKEYFFVLKITIINQPTVLRSHQQNYNFKFILPDDVPPTIVTPLGKIRYKIKATLERPWDRDIIYQNCFGIGTAFNVNLFYPPYLQPIICSRTIKYFSLFKLNCKVDIKLHVPKCVYAIDDEIPVSVEVNNMSQTSVSFIFRLEENIVYGCTTKSNSQNSRKLSKIKCIRVEGQSELVVEGNHENFVYNLRVPHVVGTTIESSNIEIRYNLVVKLVGQGLHLDRSFTVPMSIFNKELSEK